MTLPKYASCVLTLLILSLLGVHAAEPAPEFAPRGRAFLEKYCLACHSGARPKGELSLEPYRDTASVVKQRKIWDGVRKMIVAGEMPPKQKDRPRPTVAEAEAFTTLVQAVFDHADRNARPDPGRVTMRRLNRTEYRNTIRDLIGIEFDPTEDFPSDDIGHGFDNIGDVLTLSPVLMERYLAAAETIMSRAITPVPPPVTKRHLASVYTEPASADSHKLVEKGFRRMTTDGKEFIEVGPINTPYQWEDGEYIFRTRVYGSSGTDKPLHVSILVHGQDLENPSAAAELVRLSGNVLKPARLLKTFAVTATAPDRAEVLEVRVPPLAHRHRMLIAIDRPAPGAPPAKVYVEYLALEGPLDTHPPSHRRLLAATPGKSQAEQTREVLSRFLRRAYRRPATADELARSSRLVEKSIAAGDKWESGIQLAMQAALCSPKFLFRVETDDTPTSKEVRPLDEFQLASRLSYFLWSSMPDDTLLDLAEKKQLTANLDAQVRRMLADPRSAALVQNFAMQWLQVKRIDFISPDGQLFPTFNEKLRVSMLKETELFVGSIFREDRSILELIDADYTFLNEPLARHYGIADTNGTLIGQRPTKPGGQPIRGDQFQRVALTDRSRGGLVTQASVLTVTSNPTRTSPVKRGKWVLEQLLGAPPPPPPANVPELPEKPKDIAAASLRQRMEVHRRNLACANCHAKMDPIGFALENFNAVGAFRAKDGTFDVDATGEFSDGTRFTGPAELKGVLLKRKQEFARCLAEKLLIYALGRGLEHYDRPTVEAIVKALEAGDYKFSVLVTRIVQSDAFRKRRGL
jgi:hypothetical protein